MVILENVKILNVSIEPNELAKLIDDYSDDWLEALTFLANYGRSIGVYIDEDAVSKLIKEKYE